MQREVTAVWSSYRASTLPTWDRTSIVGVAPPIPTSARSKQRLYSCTHDCPFGDHTMHPGLPNPSAWVADVGCLCPRSQLAASCAGSPMPWCLTCRMYSASSQSSGLSKLEFGWEESSQCKVGSAEVKASLQPGLVRPQPWHSTAQSPSSCPAPLTGKRALEEHRHIALVAAGQVGAKRGQREG